MTATVMIPGASAESCREVVVKTAVVHTITYFVAGVAAFTLFDYPALIATTQLGTNIRPLSHPMILAGPLLQPIRGALFGLVFYLLRGPFFGSRSGWIVMWVTLAALGVVGTFGAPGASIEGVIYTTLPWSLHFTILPELLIQPLLLSVVVFQWIRHPEKRWLGRTIWAAFVVVVSLATLVFVTTARG